MQIAVIGAGSWGSALAKHASECGHRVRLWCREPAVADDIAQNGCNGRFLPEIQLGAVEPTTELKAAATGAALIISAVPSGYVAAIWRELAPCTADHALIVSATKGFDATTQLTMTTTIARLLDGSPARLVALSGPTFADEVARERPSAVVCAGDDPAALQSVQKALSGPRFRIYTNHDRIGVEVAGGAKNVIAIAAGIADGLQLGSNSRAALITRGLDEITRLGCAMGGQERTMRGLAGLGDLVLTCTSDKSRNRRAGLALGRSGTVDTQTDSVAEGLQNAQICRNLAQQHGLELPIITAVADILARRLRISDAVEQLLARDLRAE